MMSLLLDEVALAALRLAEAGVESPRTDAELIAASVHNVRRGELHTVPDREFDARFWAEIARRAAREPLQHITGSAHFRYLELDVRSEEHTSELQSLAYLVCRLLLEKKKKIKIHNKHIIAHKPI